MQVSGAQVKQLRAAAVHLAELGIRTPATAAASERDASDPSQWPPRLLAQLTVDVHANDVWLIPLDFDMSTLPTPTQGLTPGESPPDHAPAETVPAPGVAPWVGLTGTRTAAPPPRTAGLGIDLSIPATADTRSAAALLAQPGVGEPLLFDGLLDSLRGVPVKDLDGIGEKALDRLVAGGVASVYDLLMRVPLRYVDRTQLLPLGTLRSGMKQVTFIARVVGIDANNVKRYVRFTLGDNETRLSAMFFNSMWMRDRFTQGELVIVQGDVNDFNGRLQMSAPLLEPMTDASAPLMAIYPQSQKHEVSTWMLRRAAVDALRRIEMLDDPIPTALLTRRQLPARLTALRAVHVPDSKRDADTGRNRLAYDELLRLQLALGVIRNAQAAHPGVVHAPTGRLLDEWLRGLPYSLTGAQTRAIAEIRSDMLAPRPMDRLLQGDVGAGKTACLTAAALIAIEGGYQAALLAPTEILARQHFDELAESLRPLGVTVDLLVSKNLPRPRRPVLEDIASGATNLIVGTHSLLSDQVVFSRLGLALIDEQHRFGVDQRALLHAKGPSGSAPDILQATATPIPRTAAISTYGDLELSILDEKPPGRTAIATEWIDRADPADTNASPWAAVRAQVAQGRQAFVVCPLVKVSGKESETQMAAAAEETAVALAAGALEGLRIGIATGKQKPSERSEVMRAFKAHELDVLVATTVIEVGVSVPNATVITVLDAVKFGLAQLHQLRGRVGRGQWAGQCWLVGEAPGAEGASRMEAMCETDDGFVLAERDLQIRGPGALTGSAQAGRDAGLLVANLIDDHDLHMMAREDARALLERDPYLLRSLTLKRELEAALGDDAKYLTRS
ncbi:MAG: ATP-dependent DNA helicase RecG [Candidatus Nanopelagicales bacterium]